MSAPVILVDLSSLAVPIWKMSSTEPDPNFTSTKIVERIRNIAQGAPHVAICCDSGRSFRKDVVETYKANRPERDEPMHHQIRLACERLTADGFPVWSAKGFEADDLIATAVRLVLERDETTEALVVSADKDLLALVGPRVRQKSVRNGHVFDEAGVVEAYGVRPDQIRDYLTLVGDTSDNVKGAKGIGEKKAAELLERFGTLKELYQDLNGCTSEKEERLLGITPALAASLREFETRLDETRQLITLRTDVPIPIDELFAERVAAESAAFGQDDGEGASEDTDTPQEEAARTMSEPQQPEAPTAPQDAPQTVKEGTIEPAPPTPTPKPKGPATVTALQPMADDLAPPPTEWERQLDPRSMGQAIKLARDLFDSRMFSAYGTPQAVLSTVMLGRELGLPAMASLRSVHVIEGKHSLSASLMAALVLRSGIAEYFEPVEISDTKVTYATKRVNGRREQTLTHTIEMARQAWSKGKTPQEREASWLASGWGRNPTDMLVARCQARLARLVYPDLLAGLYTPEELAEIREAA